MRSEDTVDAARTTATLIQAESVWSTTDLRAVSRTVHAASPKLTSNRHHGRRHRVTAKALRRILKASIREPFALAVSDARLDSHAAAGRASASQGTSAAVAATSDVFVAHASHVGHVGCVELDNWLVGAALHGGVARTLLHAVAAGKFGERSGLAQNVFLNVAGDVASGAD